MRPTSLGLRSEPIPIGIFEHLGLPFIDDSKPVTLSGMDDKCPACNFHYGGKCCGCGRDVGRYQFFTLHFIDLILYHQKPPAIPPAGNFCRSDWLPSGPRRSHPPRRLGHHARQKTKLALPLRQLPWRIRRSHGRALPMAMPLPCAILALTGF